MGNSSSCRAGKLNFSNCLPPPTPHMCTHNSQIKSVLGVRPVIQGKWRTGGGGSTHIEEENSDWERVS